MCLAFFTNLIICFLNGRMVSGSAMWADWIVTLPLYLYTYITPNFGDPPSFVDGLSVVLSAIVVIGGFTMNISGVSPALATCIFTFNLVAFVGCCVCIYLSNNSPPLDISPEKAIMRRVLLLMFFFVMPIYPLVFFVSCLGIIESSMTAVLFNALGMLAKGLFGVIILDLDIRIFVRVEASLDVELKARQRRKDFLRYMFHELRIPLNAISMSAELSKQICSDPSAQYLREICEYAEFIDHALARYMRTEKIEDGTFELISNPFPLDVLWKQIDSFSVKYARNRDVRVIRNMRKCADLPRVLNGDVDMLILALENLICLAIHRTRIGGRLIVDIEDVSRDVDFNANNCRIGFHFEDFGEYMTDNQIDNIFIPFSSLMLGEISTNGYSSLGLFAAKEVLSRYDSAFFVRGKSDGSGIEYSFDICVPIGATIPLSTNNERIENKVRDVKFNDTVFSPQATPVIASTHSRPARARGINAGAEDKNTFSNLRILVVDGKPSVLLPF